MTTITKSYRFRVATAGATAVSGFVDWTETVNIADPGEVGGQTVHPLKGQTTARPWSVTIVDVNEVITARLSDANGRAHLLRRLADLSVSTDGGSSWTVLATARIDRIVMEDVTAFRFEMQDERIVERETTIFKGSNTTRLLPRGLHSAWLDYQPAVRLSYNVNSVDAPNDTTTYVFGGVLDQTHDFPFVSEAVMRLLEDDVIDNPAANQGNFRTLRANVAGTDRQIVEMNTSPATDPIKKLREESMHRLLAFKVAGFEDTVGQRRDVYLHMQTRDPSPELPWHIGGQVGIDPFTLVKAIYDGSYQDAANPATVRYESTRFTAYNASTNPHGLIDNPRFPKMHFRVTGPENMARWLEDNVYGPLGVTPFVNAAGEVSPRITIMPAIDQVPDPSTLPELNATSISVPHPGWTNDGREFVTVVEVTFEYARPPSFIREKRPLGPGGSLVDVNTPTDGGQPDVGVDLFQTETLLLTHEHDRAANYRAVHEITVRGFHRAIDRKRYFSKYAYDLCERFGDGPIYTDALPLSSAAAPVEGDWVRLNLPGSYPALQNQSRTGSRLAQVMTKVVAVDGARFELLEAGPNSQPLGTPSINLTANTNDPENAIDVTITGLVTDGYYEVHLAEPVAGAEPAASHPNWQYRHVRGRATTGGSSATVTVRGLPAGITIWGRARQTGVGRVASDWSARDSQATTSLSAPSAVAESSVSGDAATVSWTNGEADFDVMVDLILTSGGAQVQDPVRLPAGSTRYRFTNLTPSIGYTARVWHADSYGGESTKATDTFTTSAGAQTLSPPVSIQVLVGLAP